MEGNLAFNLHEMSYIEILRKNLHVSTSKKIKKVTISILSNITVNPLKEILELYIKSLSADPIIKFGNYNNVVQNTFEIDDTDIVIIFFEIINLSDDFYIQVELMSEVDVLEVINKSKLEIDLIFKNLSIKNVIFNAFTSCNFSGFHSFPRNLDVIVIELNNYLHTKKPANVIVVDINRIISYIGIKEAYNYDKFTLNKSLYNIVFFKHYVSAIDGILLSILGKQKKVLVLDCDNTLWKGIIGEDGPDGVDMSPISEQGIYFNIAQRIVSELSRKGVLICLCSKNNFGDINTLINNHPDMVLNVNDLVAMKVNWRLKHENIIDIAIELNLSLDSFIFIDDSSFEINLIKLKLPDVITFEVPKDLKLYPLMLLEISQRYFNLKPLEEDLNKKTFYKQQQNRLVMANDADDINSYLVSLETKAIISINNFKHIARISQLTKKTHQFNLTNKVYSEDQILNFMKRPEFIVFSIQVFDKFGDMGVSGVLILKESHLKNTIEIDTFLLSCRILGRKIELFFLDYVLKFCINREYKSILAFYNSTIKNIHLNNFYLDNHFEPYQTNKDYSVYIMNSDNYFDNEFQSITLVN